MGNPDLMIMKNILIEAFKVFSAEGTSKQIVATKKKPAGFS